MPRGEHLKKVEDSEILSQFNRKDLGRSFFTAAEVADGLDVTTEAVRQRLHNMKGDEVETEKMAGTTFWKRKGETVFADGAGLFFSQEAVVLSSIARDGLVALLWLTAGVLSVGVAAGIDLAVDLGIIAFGAITIFAPLLFVVIHFNGADSVAHRWNILKTKAISNKKENANE